MKKNSFRRDDASKLVDVSSSGSEDRGLADRHGTLESDMIVATTLRGSGQEQKEKDSYVSEAQVLANRRNALKSTGPGDTSLTRFNALKHGLTSKKMVVTPVENPTEYDTLVKALLQDFQPQTTTEKLLIQQVATCQWRRQRVIKVEKAQLESKVFDAPFEFHRNEQVRRDGFQSELGSICFNPNRPEEIDEEIKYLKDTYERRRELHISKQLAPDLDALMIRYDSTLERQFYRALVMLLKIQAARQGHVSS